MHKTILRITKMIVVKVMKMISTMMMRMRTIILDNKSKESYIKSKSFRILGQFKGISQTMKTFVVTQQAPITRIYYPLLMKSNPI